MSSSVNYDFSKLKSVFMDFYNVTGINVNLVTTDYRIMRFNKIPHNDYCTYIQSTQEGREACKWSDIRLIERCRESKKCEVHVCHAGLVDVAVPLIYDDIILGYLIFGQMRTKSSKCPCEKTALEYFDALPLADDKKIESIRKIATMLANHILFEDMLKPESNALVIKTTAYIDENLEKELTIDIIAKNVHVSKSTLYHNFHKFLKCTVSEYINVKCVERSAGYLKNLSFSVDEVSSLVGYSSPSYFTMNFKKIMGITPTKYRANLAEHGGMDIVYHS